MVSTSICDLVYLCIPLSRIIMRRINIADNRDSRLTSDIRAETPLLKSGLPQAKHSQSLYGIKSDTEMGSLSS